MSNDALTTAPAFARFGNTILNLSHVAGVFRDEAETDPDPAPAPPPVGSTIVVMSYTTAPARGPGWMEVGGTPGRYVFRDDDPEPGAGGRAVWDYFAAMAGGDEEPLPMAFAQEKPEVQEAKAAARGSALQELYDQAQGKPDTLVPSGDLAGALGWTLNQADDTLSELFGVGYVLPMEGGAALTAKGVEVVERRGWPIRREPAGQQQQQQEAVAGG
jgi:hypothetical protein